MTGRSEELWERSRRVIPGGVNSPVRAWKSVGGTPRFVARGAGSRIFDEEGREYIDHVAACALGEAVGALVVGAWVTVTNGQLPTPRR